MSIQCGASGDTELFKKLNIINGFKVVDMQYLHSLFP